MSFRTLHNRPRNHKTLNIRNMAMNQPDRGATSGRSRFIGARVNAASHRLSLMLTRTGGRASMMAARKTLAGFAATGATIAIHLSSHGLDAVVTELAPIYGPKCPVAIQVASRLPHISKLDRNATARPDDRAR